MIKHLLAIAAGLTFSLSTFAKETIAVVLPYTPTHSISPLFYPLIEGINARQKNYTFVLETKPGANGVLALQHMNLEPNNRVAIIAAAFVDNVDAGRIKENDYVHVVGLGDMCQSLIVKEGSEEGGIKSFASKVNEITIGGVAWGNGAHLIGLNIGEMFNLPVRNIIFKSNREGLFNMFNDDGVNFVLDAFEAAKNAPPASKVKPKVVGVACNQRLPDWPNVKTLAEQGITAPGPWAAITSNNKMSNQRRQEIRVLIEEELKSMGQRKVQQLSTLNPLVFTNQSISQFYDQKAAAARAHLLRYKSLIDADRGSADK